jgi:hypothetical protein
MLTLETVKDLERIRYGPATHTYSLAPKIVDAARATVGLPDHSDSFQAQGGDRYLGGGLDFSNPARVTILEAQYLWPHVLDPHPDILVSIGSGYSGHAPAPSDSPTQTDSSGDCKNTEAIWSNTFGQSSQQNPARYIRLCPEFPDADNTKTLESGYLENVTAEFLEHDQRRTETQDSIGSKVELIVRRLMSTTFYFHQTSPLSREDRESVISGM